jgi:hypothetical protein
MNQITRGASLLVVLLSSLCGHAVGSTGDALVGVVTSSCLGFRQHASPSAWSASAESRAWDGWVFAEGQKDSIGSVENAGSNLKDPNAALTYALFPGVIAHGAGHIYAGEVRTGLVLLGSELGGLALYAWGAATGVERGQPSSEGVIAMATGGALFFGSWAYDLVFAPLGVRKKNEQLLRARNARLKLRTRDEQVGLVLVWRF